MSALPSGRGFAVAVLFAAFIPPAFAEPRPFGALAVPDPAETTAAADPALATACQAAARERFGQERLTFGRPTHTARDDQRIVRMDLTVAGEGFRVVCSRDGASSPVETVVVAGPADDVGPRVIVLGGPPTAPRAQAPTQDRGYRLVSRDPNAATDASAAYPGYAGSYLPGLWVPFGGVDCVGCRRFVRDRSMTVSTGGAHVFVKIGEPAIQTVRPATNRFVEVRRGSSAPFSSGGIASPTISNFPAAAPRGGGFRAGRIGGGGVGVGAIGR